jgi:hypothetical protein
MSQVSTKFIAPLSTSLNANSQKVINVATPTAGTDAANKTYADGVVSGYVKADGTVAFTGDQSMGSHKITNLLAPVSGTDAANKTYADGVVSGYVKADGTVAFTGDQSMGSHKITSLATPTLSTDAATKGYVDGVAVTVTNGYDKFTLVSGDITNQYIDLTHVAKANSILLQINGLLMRPVDDFTVNLTGGSGGNTRILFVAGGSGGDIGTGGAAALVSGDIVYVKYMY